MRVMWLKYIWLCDLTCDYTLESDVAASGGGRRRVPHPRSGERVAKISPIRKHLTGVSSRFASRTRLNLGRGTGEVDSLKSKVVITLRDLMTSNLFLSDETISSIVSTVRLPAIIGWPLFADRFEKRAALQHTITVANTTDTKSRVNNKIPWWRLFASYFHHFKEIKSMPVNSKRNV